MSVAVAANDQGEDLDVCECEDVADDRPLRQGDVFAWIAPSEDPWKQHGVIVTADCDIAHDKHRGILSYVPILTVPDYVRLFHLPRQLDRALEAIEGRLAKLIQTAQVRYKPEFPEPLNKEAAIEWAMAEDADVIAAELSIGDERFRGEVVKHARSYRAAVEAKRRGELVSQATALRDLHVLTGRSASNATTAVADAASSLINNPPGDCFFLNAVSRNRRRGYMAYLRMIREIRDTNVAIRRPELDDASVRRISRLQSPFLYRLTQQLGSVFSDIGLPTDYEKGRKIASSTLDLGLVSDDEGEEAEN